jgi:tetrahydromethanopterin S-methyltransferase subunit G
MNMAQDSNERLVRLEKDLEALKASTDKIETKVDAMYDAFVQAKGARWVIITLWIGIGAMLANIKVLLAALGVKFGA